MADFETTTSKFYEEYGYTKVWLYAICDMNANIVNIGSSIEEFITYISTKLKGKTIYFHNLKFDGEFILYYLLTNGYNHYEQLKDVNRGFSTLIGEMGEFYSLDIKFGNKKLVHIHDSYKLLPFKVEKIARDFGLPILKEKIDYNDYTINDETIKYVSHDVRIVAMALSQIKSEGMNKMTTASCAYSMFKSMRSSDYMSLTFPELDDDFLTEWRNAYRGGRCQVHPHYQGNIEYNVKRYDINSMYPSIMRNEQLPYGKPVPIDKMGVANFELYHIQVMFKLKEGHLPTLLKKATLFSQADSYYIETDEITDIWISSIDYELLVRHYDIIYLKIIKMFGFRTCKWLFNDYVDKWYAKKSVDSGAKKIVDKFMLNCLYGKFGSNHIGATKIPYFDTEDEIIGYNVTENKPLKKYYLPLAIAVVSYAHKYIDDAIVAVGYENFLYCDTDSVHTFDTLPPNMVDNKELGKFKLEAIEQKAKYVRQKTYITMENDEIHITCAGMPDSMKREVINKYGDDMFIVFSPGFKVEGKLLPKRVKGGVILNETSFEIKV